jgi:diaminopimelate decarboxylase
MPAVVQHVASLADAYDVASVGEMKVMLGTPTPAGKISFVGSETSEGEMCHVSAVGAPCTPLGMLADKAGIGHACVGDLIAVLQFCAIGVPANPAALLGCPAPLSVLV